MAVVALFAAYASSADGASGGVAPTASKTKAKKHGKRRVSRDIATWYGPGLYGNGTACGKRLRPRTVGVAHKRLPCGTQVVFRYRGRRVKTRVIDRGPYAHGAKWDLTERAAKKLGFLSVGVDRVRASVHR